MRVLIGLNNDIIIQGVDEQDIILPVDQLPLAMESGFIPDDTVPIPSRVSARQARLALLGAGMLHLVEDALNALDGPQGQAARIEWEYATFIERNSPLIEALSPLLGLSENQVDNLFIAAGNL